MQISTVRLMTSETCESIAQKIISHHSTGSSSSSSFSSPSTLLLQDSKVKFGIETEFVESQKIQAQFQIPMQSVPDSSTVRRKDSQDLIQQDNSTVSIGKFFLKKICVLYFS